MCEASGHEHRNYSIRDEFGFRTKPFLGDGLIQSTKLRHRFRHRRNGRLCAVRSVRLAAFHLSSGDLPTGMGLCAAATERRPGHVLVWLDRHDTLGGNTRRLYRHPASGKRRQKNSAVSSLGIAAARRAHHVLDLDVVLDEIAASSKGVSSVWSKP